MNNSQHINIKFDLRIVCIILLLIIAGMLAAWRPWQQTTTAATRKVTITGEATVKSTPDEFVFNPSFDRTGTDLTSMKNDLNSFGTKLQADLLKLGVAKSDITLDSSSYDSYGLDYSSNTSQTITLQATITVPNQTLAQKVQDYLAGTDAKGQLTAQPQFSTAKQKSLQNTARLQAVADARSKAEQTAANAGAKLGKVIEINDQTNGISGGCGGGRGYMCPLSVTAGTNADTSTASLPVTAGTNEVTSSVQVVFALD